MPRRTGKNKKKPNINKNFNKNRYITNNEDANNTNKNFNTNRYITNNEDANEQIIMALNLTDLNSLLTAINERSILVSAFINNEKEYSTKLNLYNTQIDGLKQTLESDMPEYLKEMAQAQMDNALIEKSDLEQKHETIITQHNYAIRIISNFTNYDWNIDMTELVVDRIKHFENLKSIEVRRLKIEQLALLKREQDDLRIREKEQLLNEKKHYVINKCIPYLLKRGDFKPDLSRLTNDDYLDELISNAHRSHYRDICDHCIDLDDDDEYTVFTIEESIKACNGWYQYNDKNVYDEETGELIDEPCCHKRFCFGVSKDILEFDNGFNMDTKECMCKDDLTYVR
jgi:hypothetical protein